MAERLTIYEVARHAGVSIASVSRVLHDRPGVSTATRDHIRSVVQQLGYLPNGTARALASSRVGVIGLVFPDLDDPSPESEHGSLLYVDEVIRGAERAAREAGHVVLIAATHHATATDLAFQVAGKVDGLVVLARSVSDADIATVAARVPLVQLAAESPLPGVDRVIADNHGGGHAVTRHLLDTHGYRELAFLGGPADSPDGLARFQGYCRALAESGLPLPDQPEATGDFTEAGGRRAASTLLAADRRPRAVVAANDQMAVGLMSVLGSAAGAVPETLAVTGFDDIQLARVLSPALTTVRQPMRQLGAICVRMVLERVADRALPARETVLPTAVIVRQSCGCAPGGGGDASGRQRNPGATPAGGPR